MTSIVVTGGTGSFGNAFVRRCLRERLYSRFTILSRDELKQSQMRAQLELEFGDLARDTLRFFIGDVRNKLRLEQVFAQQNYVVHAAAMKNVPIAEYNPLEAIETNVQGSINVVLAAADQGVEKVVALSSDKACAPLNLYGKTKALMESLVCQANVYSARKTTTKTKFSCVRYGNVLGSRGSVIELWGNLDKEILVTDPLSTRFFMTVNGACELVLQTLSDMEGGEIFVPKIRSFTIGNLALAIVPGKEWKIIGMRPGEKIHEELIANTEAHRTLDQGSRYVILPVAREWASGEIRGEKVPVDFHYDSYSNPLRVDDVAKIKEWVEDGI